MINHITGNRISGDYSLYFHDEQKWGKNGKFTSISGIPDNLLLPWLCVAKQKAVKEMVKAVWETNEISRLIASSFT